MVTSLSFVPNTVFFVLSSSYNYVEVLIISYQCHMYLILQLQAHDFSNYMLLREVFE